MINLVVLHQSASSHHSYKPLSGTLTYKKSPKMQQNCANNSPICHTYSQLFYKSFSCHTYKKTWGWYPSSSKMEQCGICALRESAAGPPSWVDFMG
jgi:hypothetical protein